MPEIQFYGVSKNYGNVKAVDDLNFTIRNGEYLSLLGPSGCGKTTTLRIISGLILPTEGKILWDGKEVQHLTAAERDIGYVFQQFAIFPHLNVWENIAFGPNVKGIPSAEIEETVETYIKLVGLRDKANHYPKSLDAADKQRVGIARVLATGATTLLLDEPMGALDQKIREKFQDELLNLVKSLNLTAIHVTHDQSEALAISDRIGVMKKGKMIQIASPNELLYKPVEIFSAHFIGESDFFIGNVTKFENNSYHIELMGYEIIQVSSSQMDNLVPDIGQRVVIGIRREFFGLKSFEESDFGKPNVLYGEVSSDRFLGEKIRTKVIMDYGRSLEVKRHPNLIRFQKGTKVTVIVPPDGVFVFRFPSEGLETALSVT